MSTTEEIPKPVIATRLKEFLFLLLTPLYLSLVFYKLSTGADFEGILAVSLVIFVLYLPIQVIASQYEIPLSFDAIFEHEEVLSLIYPLFGIITLTGLFYALQYLGIDKNVLLGVGIAGYGLWWLMTEKLFALIKNGDAQAKVKMVAMFMFMLGLLLIIKFPNLPKHIDGYYFLELAITVLYVIGIVILMIPRYTLKALGILYKDAFKSMFRPTSLPLLIFSPLKALEASIAVILIVFMLFTAVFVPFINWANHVVAGWNPTAIAIVMTIFMIVVSAFGAYFQLRIFISYFVKEHSRVKRSSTIFLTLFYISAVINMGLLGTIKINTEHFKSSQQKIKKLNQSVHDFDRKIRSY